VALTMAALRDVLDLVAAGETDATDEPATMAAEAAYRADAVMTKAAQRLREDARNDLARARYGTIGVMGLLFVAFASFYWTSARARRAAERLSEERQNLLAQSRAEALTDALTGLQNRRSLMLDLEAAAPAPGEQLVLALFDLDGFKAYNDSFGHPAGDMLLTRLGERLAQTMRGVGSAYRMGGDEFCVLAPATEQAGDGIAALAASALSETGTAFSVGCSYGVAEMPHDTTDAKEALLLADQRMYLRKEFSRVSPSRQSAAVLIKLQTERSNDLGRHTHDVGELVVATAGRLGLTGQEIERLSLAAELHDVGKVAIPDAILDKPGALEPGEWEFIRRHTLIGESIVLAAPSLAHAAPLVRSSHERVDGQGYPDGLSRDEIPIGARIIAVCDAFDAIVSDRPYRRARSEREALAELRRCAGSQFDPTVVEAFAAVRSDARVGISVAPGS
jgi:diguanylate cyclase (GGDEF)-like protein